MSQADRAARETMAGIVGKDLSEAKAEGEEAYQANLDKLADNLGEHASEVTQKAIRNMSAEQRKRLRDELDALDADGHPSASPPPS